MKKLLILTLTFGLFCLPAAVITAQEQPPTQQPSTEELEKQKAEREKNAYRLLDQVIDEAQSLRLVENRVRVQISAADMLWDQNQGRARGLFAMAAEGVAELGRTPVNTTNNRRAMQEGNGFAFQGPPGQQIMRNYQLRQELVLTAARHDAALAYQLLATTKPPVNIQATVDLRGPRAQMVSDENLEQTLLGRVAALDPKLAAQNAEQMLEKGQFPGTLSEVINQLYKQDPEAADKLADKTVKKIQAANLLTKTDMTGLVQNLLRPGPRPAGEASASTAQATTTGRRPVLGQAAYVDLLSTVIDAALKVTPAAQNNQRGSGPQAVRRGPVAAQTAVASQPPTEAQIEQNNARRLLASSQLMLPMIDQYLPLKAQAIRQKLTELGMSSSIAQTINALQGEPTADALVQAAATAPPQMQSRLYQQAANKAIDEGDTERARQIANEHLQNNARDAVMQRIDFREMAKKAEGARLDEIRQSVARLQTDNDKIDLLILVASDVQKTNQKVALQILEDAKQIVNHRATSYEHFEQQLRVSRAFASVDPARSFEVLDPGINQLNELLSAASVLSGFEINMFRDGEMAIQGGNGLTAMVNRFGQELAALATSDFERSETLAGRFQFAESRIITRLSIVRGLLGVKPATGQRVMFGNVGESIVINPD
ncbi:MAG TPA: hypothetical protein VGQ41_11695 [Pyrinomonadaceae bacterium]|jgi:hypothetical protein|nr:hypothetical protein [Pyrinomonadaceae bacterium]